MTSQLKVDRISPATGSEIIIDGFGGGGLASMQTFTSSGTWTKPSGVTKVMVEVQGAGGGGGGSSSASYAPGCGAGGGYTKKIIDVSSISSATITVGSGGSGGVSSATGVSGGLSSWSDGTNTLTANGGTGGNGNSGAGYGDGGSGGTASGGDLNITGGDGVNSVWSIIGGGSFFCSSTLIRIGDTANANGYGGGGTGSKARITTGGNGSDGIVIVTEY